MKKYKILFTIPNFDTAGSGKAMLKIAERLDKNIFEPHIACTHNKGAFFKKVEESGIPIHIYPYFHSMSSKLKGIIRCWQDRKFFKTFDLIHSFHYSDDYSEALSAKFAGTKWVYVKKNMNWNSNAWKLRTKLSTAIVAQNTDMLEQFFKHDERVTLIPRGVDIQEFKPIDMCESLLKELNLKKEQRIILLVANLVPVKGVEYLVNAFEQISDKYTDTVLVIVGDDSHEYATQLKVKAKSSIDNHRIIFTGKRPDIKDFQSIAKIFVLPTLNKGRQEGSPVSLLEAMASGTYVLASNVAGIRDQLSEIPEQLFTPADSNDIAIKLEKALNLSDDAFKKVEHKQLEIIKSKYTLNIEVKKHEDFYKKVLGI
jgi:glycosyltransferase involved in cell wall biosynthesis